MTNGEDKMIMNIYIFIDESGTLPDPNDRRVVLVAVAADNREIFTEIYKKMPKIRKARELKFYSAGEKTKEAYLNNLAKENVAIFTLAVDKKSQKIADTPANYAVLSWLLLLDCLAYYRNDELKLVFDRHFHRRVDENSFFKTLQKLLGRKCGLESADSRKETGITAADFVAGAFLYSQNGKSTQFYKIIEKKIISEKVVNWKEAKKKFIEALKNSPEPVQAPIRSEN